jgi:phage-related tail protein
MPEPTGGGRPSAPPTTNEEQAIRDRVRDLTSQVLQQGRIDPEAVREVMRAVTGRAPGDADRGGADSRELLVDEIKKLDEAIATSAAATREALERLTARGKDFTDNDLKEALVSLRKLEEDSVQAASRIADALGGNLRREIMELAAHAQGVGVEASARIANLTSELTARLGGATAGLNTLRGASVRMALLASGALAGIADALRPDSKSRTGE